MRYLIDRLRISLLGVTPGGGMARLSLDLAPILPAVASCGDQ